MPYLSTSTVFFYSILPFVSYGLSQVEAEALNDGIMLFNRDYYNSSRGTGSDNENSCRFGRTCGKADKVLPDGLNTTEKFIKDKSKSVN